MLSTKRKGIQSDRSIKKRRKKLIWVWLLFLVAVGSVATSIVLLARASFLQIKNVEIVATQADMPDSVFASTSLVSPADRIQSIAESDLAGRQLYFFPKTNTFLYPKNKIRNDILAAFPRVSSVTVSRKSFSDFDTLDIAVSERTPYALACRAGADDQCFYMDSTGFIYAAAPQFSSGVYVRYYDADTEAAVDGSSAITIGKNIADESQLAIARRAVDYISGMKIQVAQVSINDDEYTLKIKDTYATSSRPAATSTASTSQRLSTVYFNMSQPLDTTLEYFLNFWQSRADKDFDYIDLRYGKDIVFKMH